MGNQMKMQNTVSANDVAAEILNHKSPITAMKLQKLLYYCQAWSLVWDEEPLFSDKIEAWVNGPIVPNIYQLHKGLFEISEWKHGNKEKLQEFQKETIKSVVDYYGDKPAQWLSDLTHLEDPWKNARKGLADSERGNQEITLASLAEYYGSLPQ